MNHLSVVALVGLLGSAGCAKPNVKPLAAPHPVPSAPADVPAVPVACPPDAQCTSGNFPQPGLVIVTATNQGILDARTGDTLAAEPDGDGPATTYLEEFEVTLEQLEAVDFDGDGIDEIVQVELSRSESTASRYAAIYRIHDGVLALAGSWSLMESNGTEGTGCGRTFSYSEPGSSGARTVTISGGEFAGMSPDDVGASNGCAPEPHDYVLRSGRFAE